MNTNVEPEAAEKMWREGPHWKIHTSALLEEISKRSGQAIYRIPLSMLGKVLFNVGQRAAELNDPVLNALMCQLAIYTIADPYSPDYDPHRVEEICKALPK